MSDWSIISDLPNQEYHSRKTHIGSTGAKHILTSRQKFFDLIQKPSKKTQAMRDGEAFHLAVLQPDEYLRRIASEPINDRTGKPYGVDTAAYQAFIEKNPEAIFPPDFIAMMIERMPCEVSDLLKGGRAEASYFGCVCGIQVKFRPDYIVETNIYDLKSIDDIDNIERAIAKYQYWFSAAWYRRLAMECTGKKHTFTLVFAEKNPPYRWRIVELGPVWFTKGNIKVDFALDEIRKCQESGSWKDDDDINIMVDAPDYEAEDMEGVDL